MTARIIANADSYMVISGLIAGQHRKTNAAIDALEIGTASLADLNDILATAKSEAQALLAQVTSPPSRR